MLYRLMYDLFVIYGEEFSLWISDTMDEKIKVDPSSERPSLNPSPVKYKKSSNNYEINL